MTDRITPLPWRAPFINDGEDYISITDDEQLYGICRLDESYSEHKEQMKANAAYIVHACNTLPKLEALNAELVDAAKEAFTALNYQLPSEHDQNYPSDKALVDKLKAAIQKAKGVAK